MDPRHTPSRRLLDFISIAVKSSSVPYRQVLQHFRFRPLADIDDRRHLQLIASRRAISRATSSHSSVACLSSRCRANCAICCAASNADAPARSMRVVASRLASMRIARRPSANAAAKSRQASIKLNIADRRRVCVAFGHVVPRPCKVLFRPIAEAPAPPCRTIQR